MPFQYAHYNWILYTLLYCWINRHCWPSSFSTILLVVFYIMPDMFKLVYIPNMASLWNSYIAWRTFVLLNKQASSTTTCLSLFFALCLMCLNLYLFLEWLACDTCICSDVPLYCWINGHYLLFKQHLYLFQVVHYVWHVQAYVYF